MKYIYIFIKISELCLSILWLVSGDDRILGSENIDPSDVKFGSFSEEKATCKLKSDQMVRN
jgi:hypothetical protein